MTALVVTTFQVSTLMDGLCLEFDLKILPMGDLLHLERTGCISIPDKRCVQADLIITGLPQCNEDVLFLVASDQKYGEQVLYN